MRKILFLASLHLLVITFLCQKEKLINYFLNFYPLFLFLCADAYNQLIPSGCYDYSYDIIETNGYNLMSNILLFLSFLICYISLQGNYSTCLAGIISIISENNSQMIFSIIIAYMQHHMLNYPLRLLMSLILISFYM